MATTVPVEPTGTMSDASPPVTAATATLVVQKGLLLGKLPIEMVVNILSHLPVREIAKIRLICKELKNIIDTQEITVLKPTTAQFKYRIELFKAAYVDPIAKSPNTPVTAALNFAAYLSRHPNWQSPTSFRSRFVLLWEYRCTGVAGTGVIGRSSGVVSVLNLMLAVDLKYHPRAGNPQILRHAFGGKTVNNSHDGECKDAHTFYTAMVNEMNGDGTAVEQMFGTSRFEDWKSLFLHLRDTPGGVFQGVNGLIGELRQPWQPLHRLTGKPTQSLSTLPAFRRMIERFMLRVTNHSTEYLALMFDMEDVVTYLDAPALPMLQGLNVLSYCLQTQWAWNAFKEAVDDGKQMNAYTKAAVQQELYII